MDGHFVPNIVMGAPVLKSVHKNVPDIFMDCHMMVSEPAKWIKDIAEAGDNPLDVVRQIKATKMRASIAINPGTPASEISDELGNAVDMILVMTVWPGAGGQKFMKECMPKVAELRARFPELDVEVDGGVGPKTIDRCADAGANVIVAGTAVFNHSDPKAVIAFLRKQCERAQERIREERERIANGESISDMEKGRGYTSGSVTPWSHPRVYMPRRRSSGTKSPPAGLFGSSITMQPIH
ncbi:ribulose-phosphate 3-epimerase [Malassezia obtusa]|uniref:Ribulose-phosphate 3-epimerase n=1 Tax=Malassezia obtusa TaxID=76774 RepID=A0AAF0E1J1_9BASI|nr:ribulose-phosphate 3-epimerase [Malassezia obtusa]